MVLIEAKFKLWIATLVLALLAAYFAELIDEPKFKSTLKGHVERCIIEVPVYEHGKNIQCTALLENDYLVRFSNLKMLNAGDSVVYVLYEREFTGLQSYRRANPRL